MALNVAKLRAQAKSPDGVVTAVVTGSGELVDLTITEAALHGPHPQEIGPAAVTAARRAAITTAAPQMRADDKLEWHSTATLVPTAPFKLSDIAEDINTAVKTFWDDCSAFLGSLLTDIGSQTGTIFTLDDPARYRVKPGADHP